ncbi:putative peptidyl-prolyl cis-trans isomerase [Pirellulimonas nuda]|uniref:peptidylprolyl isomerase n=1 Tax=Pirellulimonas nuda TaxID=2528009 RepID=A0A518D5C8_9BACT|nr:peptidylprolyl isomerase [Pirellulimonas nuda]QDU86680.1 putative peptidyl-prolyl cis-trans isomerase [Pirellulimonas nuda]
MKLNTQLVLSIGLILSASTTLAQEAQPAPAVAKFDKELADYRGALANIEKLNGEFQTAGEARRAELNKEVAAQVLAAKGELSEMIDAAIAAHQADPKADQRITDLLLTIARYDIIGAGEAEGGDQYERGLRVVNALIEGGNDQLELPVWGLVAAFVTNDFDLAEKYRDLAIEKGAFSKAPDEKDAAAQAVMAMAMNFAGQIDAQRQLWNAEQKIREAEAKADNLPRVKLTTTKGDIVVELFEDQAPQATANFITLAKKDFYKDVKFHRVLPRFMAQGGDPKGTGSGGPGYNIPCECYREDYRRHFRGTLSMAHAGRDTGGSQFFLTFVPTPNLDGKHTAFGRVVEGMEVLADLQRIDPQQPKGEVPDRILKAEVLRDRGHGYKFKKLPER